MTTDHKTFLNRYSRMEQIALLLGQVRKFIKGKNSIIPPSEYPNVIKKILKNESMVLYVNYSFGYFGIRDQLVSDIQHIDAIKAMGDLMGFHTIESKNKVKSLLLTSEAMSYGAMYHFNKAILKLKKACELDPNNTEAWHWLEEYYQQDGNFELAKNARKKYNTLIKERNITDLDLIMSNPEEEYKTVIKAFIEKRATIRDLWKKTIYKKVLHKNQGILTHLNTLLKEIQNYLRGEDHLIPKEYISEVLDDIINRILEWMSIVSSATYFKLKHNLGTIKETQEIADELLYIIGWEEHVDLKDQNGTIKSPLDFIYRENVFIDEEGINWNDIEEEQADFLEEPLREGNSFNILVENKEFGSLPVHVADYELDDIRNNIINPDTLLIPDESIKINFTYPLSVKVELMFNNKGGFTRMDIYRCIYEGYKRIYNEEEAAVGDPGTYERLMNRRPSNGPYGIWGHYMDKLIIEGINYDLSTKTLRIFIGS